MINSAKKFAMFMQFIGCHGNHTVGPGCPWLPFLKVVKGTDLNTYQLQGTDSNMFHCTAL